MDATDARSRLAALPAPPPRVFTRQDWVLIALTPAIAYIGGVIAALGSIGGLLLSGIAGLMAVTIYASRRNRTDEPVVPRHLFHVSVATSVLVMLVSVALLRTSPHEGIAAFGIPLANIAIFGVFLALLLRKRAA